MYIHPRFLGHTKVIKWGHSLRNLREILFEIFKYVWVQMEP